MHPYISYGHVPNYKATGLKVLQEIEKTSMVDLEWNSISLLLVLPSKHVTSACHRRLYNIPTFAAGKNILLQWISDIYSRLANVNTSYPLGFVIPM